MSKRYLLSDKARIFVDGHDISEYVVEVRTTHRVGELVTGEVTMYLTSMSTNEDGSTTFTIGGSDAVEPLPARKGMST